MSEVVHEVLRPGQKLGPCEIVEPLGSGGMGSVWVAKHSRLGKEVAIKVLAPSLATKPQNVDAFLKEGKLASHLEDAHIVQVYDVGKDRGICYIVMQLARGESLRERLKRSRLSVEEAVAIIEKAARGLRVAHAAGVVHRDIKPHNIILSEGDPGVKILDFGLARFEESLGEAKEMKEIAGSIAYMSPEQIDVRRADPRTDIYSLGVTFYHALTGRLPFRAVDGCGTNEVMARQVFETPWYPTLLSREVPLTISRVVMRMIEKHPDNRYATMDEVLAELRLIQRHSLPVTPRRMNLVLNPPPLEDGGSSARVLIESVKAARKGGIKLLDLPGDKRPNLQKAAEPVLEAQVIELETPAGKKSLDTYDGSKAMLDGRFEVSVNAEDHELEIEVVGDQPVDYMSAQRLFSMLEVYPSIPKGVQIGLDRPYRVAPQDVRWIVDAYNICYARGVGFAVLLRSTFNHDTLLRLGLETHIDIRLRLETGELKTAELDVLESTGNSPVHLTIEGLRSNAQIPAKARSIAQSISEALKSEKFAKAVELWVDLGKAMDGDHLLSIAPVRLQIFRAIQEAGDKELGNGRVDQAESLFNQLLELDPSRPAGHLGKGLVCKKRGKLEHAEAFLTQAIKQDSENGVPFYHRAIVRSRLGDLQGALQDLNLAIECNPRDANSYYNRSLLHKKMGRGDLSRRDLAIAGRLDERFRKPTNAKSPA